MKKTVENGVDVVSGLIEKVSSPASRSGNTVERAGKMLDEGVDSDVIALQMSKNSPNGYKYTAEEVYTLGKVYTDAKTKVVITAKQARALIRDQQELNQELNGLEDEIVFD